VLVAVVVIATVVLWRMRRRTASLAVLGATFLAYAVGYAVKHGEHRARPTAPVNLAPESEPGFVSGHVIVVTTVVGVALALSWAHLSRAGRVVASVAAVAVVLAVAVDRLVVGAHWLTDVVGGLAGAAVVVGIAVGLTRVVDVDAWWERRVTSPR
jgi:undecaprenyl-diphosphatase